MSDKHPLDEYFRKGLDEHKLKPSQSVWEKIEAAEPQPESRNGGWYIMRAAVVTLLIGLSAVFYYQNNRVGDDLVGTPVETEPANTGEKGKEQDKAQNKKSETKGTTKEVQKPKKKAVPIMRQNTGKQIYVAKEDVLSPVDEESLMEESEEFMLADVSLKVREQQEPAPLKVKFKVTPKAATEGFYAGKDAEEKKEAFKDKVYAYANNQFENIKNGRPLELPKPTKKPQLEIDLGKIFNN